jgi:chemotaxis protein CheD
MLGSCVEVCLWDRKLRMGGAVHYLLPGVPGAAARNSGRQGIQELVSAMLNAGARIQNIVGKIFGGASMIPELRGSHIGDLNIETAHACLSELRVLALQEDVGGERGRKITFLTDTGEVILKLF